jgi:hypothetical protein
MGLFLDDPLSAESLLGVPSKGTLVLVSCVAQKRTHTCPARDLYTSPWFIKARDLVERLGLPWVILSAKWGVLMPWEQVAPYDRFLADLSPAHKAQWVSATWDQLQASLPGVTHVVVLAGACYRDKLVPLLEGQGRTVMVPMAGLRIGEQLHWLDHPQKKTTSPG